MELTILSFGKLAQITGSRLVVNEPVTNTVMLQQWLHNQYPELAELRYRLAVDKEIVQENTPLSAKATVALLPPFSGG